MVWLQSSIVVMPSKRWLARTTRACERRAGLWAQEPAARVLAWPSCNGKVRGSARLDSGEEYGLTVVYFHEREGLVACVRVWAGESWRLVGAVWPHRGAVGMSVRGRSSRRRARREVLVAIMRALRGGA